MTTGETINAARAVFRLALHLALRPAVQWILVIPAIRGGFGSWGMLLILLAIIVLAAFWPRWFA